MEKKIDNIYVYLWEEFNTIYIGRTINPKGRHYAHKHRKTESTYKFSEEHGVEHPKMIIIENDLSVEKGIEREKYWIEHYKNKGNYTLLNKSCGGQIGQQKTTLTKEEKIRRRKERDKKRYQNNKEEKKEKLKEYYKKHKEDLKLKAKEYREKNREEILIQRKKYREENREKILEQKRKYREKHREELRLKTKEYKEKHKKI